MKLTITLQWGNSAMLTWEEAVKAIGESLDRGMCTGEPEEDRGRIKDDNGNKVGSWRVEDL